MQFLHIFAVYVCMVLHSRLRWSDGQYCQYEPYLDLHHGIMYVSDWHVSKWSNQLVPQKWLAQGPEHDQAVVGSLMPQFREDHPLLIIQIVSATLNHAKKKAVAPDIIL